MSWVTRGVGMALGTWTALAAGHVEAASLTKAQTDFFEANVRPVLARHCYKCHSRDSEKVKGNLLLDTRQGVLRGGETGPAIVPGNPETSLLIKAVRYTDPDLQMPPKGEKLDPAQIASLESWVRMGAPDPREDTASTSAGQGKTDREHWAFQPVKATRPPEVQMREWVANPIDAFILQRLEEKGMKPSPPTDKRTLIRRATFDLAGLPPTPEEVQAFLKDDSTNAYAKVVDRLLKSPRYGERWGRYWLDVARYSDTKGEVRRRLEDVRYPFAWTYRDYVIQSLNNDTPYNQFIIEQIAADKLPSAKTDPTRLAAMGFLTLGNHFNNNRNDIINDRIDVVTKGFLGLTVTCARCHDHMFDPIPTQDYYSLHGIFASSEEPEFEPLLTQPKGNNAEYQDYFAQRSKLAAEQQAMETQYRQLKGTSPAVRKVRRELQNKQTQTLSQIAKLDLNHPGSPPRAMAMQDRAKPADSRVFVRGEADNKGDVAPRRFLEVLSGPRRSEFHNGSGRLELAHAIADPRNPMTARVIVNRVWQHHFGQGFVSTPDDLGTQSEPPSHAGLIDYLAAELVAKGWSLKQLHRQIMLSNTYRQSSAANPRYSQIDPNNRLLWRAHVRRLDFEALRDSILAIGGRLDLTMYGQPAELEREPYSTRRSVYGYIDRNKIPEVMNHFDFANPDMPTGKRYETIVPQQALFLMNSPLVVEQAKSLVHRPQFDALTEDDSRVEWLYERVVQRPPRPEELALGLTFVADFAEPDQDAVGTEVATDSKEKRKEGRRKPGSGRRKPLTAWEEYAHALFQTSEVSFVH